MFQFKQFAVDQSGCAMKINTDGVLLAALLQGDNPQRILDIGTGTGVIALMLAQRFNEATVDAVEIDESAAATAKRNFKASKFAERLNSYHTGFEDYLAQHSARQYDLVVSNPPFYIHSLKSPEAQRELAKHTDKHFFDNLLNSTSKCLTDGGSLWLVLPMNTAELVQEMAVKYKLSIHTQVSIASYPNSDPHRQIIALSKFQYPIKISNFIIYDSPKKYTDQYSITLKDFFTIF
ncbi:tRNA1(Val) (adenine(37)-N6)-methyltransferase [Mucilaginibacter agri]|nr:methyltransferase [Mucilaginibacter agri]